jgi:hypothetical protein
VNGSTQQAVHATAASAVTDAVAAALVTIFSIFSIFFGGAQPQPAEPSQGRRQDGPITLT